MTIKYETFHVSKPVSGKHAEQVGREKSPDGHELISVMKIASAGWYRAAYRPQVVSR